MRLRFLLRKEFQQFRRNPVLLRMALLVPLAQTVVLSFAANLDVKAVPVACWDEDRSQRSRELLAWIGAAGYFVLRPPCGSEQELQRELDGGRALLALHLPPHFGRDLARGG
ncbi:MAG: hypothetical protein HUU35_20140, partial [Armatimonadetes bacterium]|nr:hypothetical protein [Armatimonadota bacterium]